MKRRSGSVALFVAASLTSLVACSRDKELAPSDRGVSSAKPAASSSVATAPDDAGPAVDLSESLAPVAATYGFPAIAVAVYKQERLLASGVTGVRRLGSPERATLDDRWVLGACSKAMTATLAAILADEGKVSFDDPLDKLLAGMKIHPSRAKDTLSMMLQHHSGMERDPSPALLEKAASATDPAAARKELVTTLVAREQTGAMGKYLYSNVAYLAAGHALERAAGKPFEALMREKIFVPLGMTSCGFGPPVVASPAQPSGHAGRDAGVEVAAAGSEARIAPALAPASSIHCSLGDWSKFLRNHVRIPKGTEPIASRASLMKIHMPAFNQNTNGGFTIEHPDWARAGAFYQLGTSGTFFATAWLNPLTGHIFMFVANADTPSSKEAAAKVMEPLFVRFR